MKYLNKIVLSAVLVMGSVNASLMADTFSFSYVFNDAYGSGGGFTGTLTGTQVGAYVTGVDVQELYVNGNLITGTIFNTSNDLTSDENWLASGSAVVSFDQALNNFLFINSDAGAPAYDGSGTGFAYLVNGFAHTPVHPDGSAALAYDISFSPGSYSADFGDGVWKLTNTSSVPDGSTTVGLLGLALIGVAAVRRKLASR